MSWRPATNRREWKTSRPIGPDGHAHDLFGITAEVEVDPSNEATGATRPVVYTEVPEFPDSPEPSTWITNAVALEPAEARDAAYVLLRLSAACADRTEPPHGYMPFLTGSRMGVEDSQWICATPFCDSVDDLLYEYDDEWRKAGRVHTEPNRICRVYSSRADAVDACWAHAERWWKGEPPAVPSIPGYRVLPPGWACFVGRDHNMWIVGPGNAGHGKISGGNLSSALHCYADECWKEYEAKEPGDAT